MKFAPYIGTGSKFDTIYFFKKYQYLHGNDKQKNTKLVKLEFYANQILHKKTNTSI